MNVKEEKYLRIQILPPLVIIIILAAGFAFATHNQSYRINNGTSVEIDEWNQCRNVTNSVGTDIFMPTNTSEEWANAYNYNSTGINYACCSQYHKQCAEGNSYWYNGCQQQQALNQTCSGAYCNGNYSYYYSGCTGGACTSTLNHTCKGYVGCIHTNLMALCNCSVGCGAGGCSFSIVYSYTAADCSGAPVACAAGSPWCVGTYS
jgi:hypothetical protein